MDLSFIPAVSSSHLGSSTPPPTHQLFIIDLLHRVSVGGEPGGPVYSPPYTPLFCSEQKFIVTLVYPTVAACIAVSGLMYGCV